MTCPSRRPASGNSPLKTEVKSTLNVNSSLEYLFGSITCPWEINKVTGDKIIPRYPLTTRVPCRIVWVCGSSALLGSESLSVVRMQEFSLMTTLGPPARSGLFDNRMCQQRRDETCFGTPLVVGKEVRLFDPCRVPACWHFDNRLLRAAVGYATKMGSRAGRWGAANVSGAIRIRTPPATNTWRSGSAQAI
jgi:hypothetical protein